MWHIQRILNKSIFLPNFLSQPFFKRFLIRTYGQIVWCHVATFMIFETFKISGQLKKYK